MSSKLRMREGEGRFVKRRTCAKRAASAMVAIILALGAAAAVAQPAEPSTTRLIVKLRDAGTVQAQALTTARLDRVAAAAASAGVTLSYLRAMALGAHVMALDRRLPRRAAEALAAQLAQSPDVEYVQPDYRRRALRVPNDPEFSSQWYLANSAYAIHAIDAWDVTTGSSSVVVAIVDTGYRPHAELAGRILPGYDFVTDPKVANDGTGRETDAQDPGDWVDADDLADPDFSDCMTEPSSWHGTSVAGVVAANSNNGQSLAGIDWSAKILPVRVLGKCGGDDSDIIDGIAWAAGLPMRGVPANPNPAQVINLSLGGDSDSCPPAYHNVFASALANGITRAIVVAAGNEGVNVAGTAPANCSEVIAVASSTRVGTLTSYSNFGPGIAVSAPGGSGGSSFTNLIAVLSNLGTTVPVGDGVAAEGGTSFAAPMVAGVAALALGLAPNLSAGQLRALLTSSVSPFSALADCESARCGSGIIDAHAAVLAAQAAGDGAANYQGIWWNAPAGSESGWGINFAHQGDRIFASWFTYDTTGRAWWLVMTANKTGANTYSGTLYTTRGPAFNAVAWSPAAVTNTVAGTGTLVFSDANNGNFTYTVGAVTQAKSITRQVFGPLPTCVWGSQPDLSLATNYQDLWWASPAASESGWGVNLNHEGNTIFATWFTYDLDGSPLWLVATANQTADPKVFFGTFYRTSGARFDAFNPASVVNTPVGFLTLTFTDGNHATMSYAVHVAGTASPAQQMKPITREIFTAPGTACR